MSTRGDGDFVHQDAVRAPFDEWNPDPLELEPPSRHRSRDEAAEPVSSRLEAADPDEASDSGDDDLFESAHDEDVTTTAIIEFIEVEEIRPAADIEPRDLENTVEIASSQNPTVVILRVDPPENVERIDTQSEARPLTRAEVRRASKSSRAVTARREAIHAIDKVDQKPDSEEDNKKRKPIAGWAWVVPAVTAALVVGGIGINSILGAGNPEAVPSRSVPAQETTPERLPSAPLGESAGEEAVGDQGVPDVPPAESIPENEDPAGEEASVQPDEAGGLTEPGGGGGGAGAGTAARPPAISVPKPPAGENPKSFSKGGIVVDQAVNRNGTRVWRIVIAGVTRTTTVTIGSTSLQPLNYPQPRNPLFVYETPVAVGSGEVAWSIETYDRATSSTRNEKFVTW